MLYKGTIFEKGLAMMLRHSTIDDWHLQICFHHRDQVMAITEWLFLHWRDLFYE